MADEEILYVRDKPVKPEGLRLILTNKRIIQYIDNRMSNIGYYRNGIVSEYKWDGLNRAWIEKGLIKFNIGGHTVIRFGGDLPKEDAARIYKIAKEKLGEPLDKDKKFCMNCGSSIDINAAICTACGRTGSPDIVDKNPMIAALLSLFVVGTGQFYLRRYKRGAVMILGVIILAFIASILPLSNAAITVLWIVSMIDAYKLAKDGTSPLDFIIK